MSSPSFSPLPFLPTEVKKEILKFCDQPTLAKTSTLSLAFLQLSSPLLYQHIKFEGPEGMTKFLTIVAEKRHPELETWLDLPLVHSVTYIDVKDDPFNPLQDENGQKHFLASHLHLPSSSTDGRLPLQSLNFVLPKGKSETRVQPFFDPVEFHLNGVPGGAVSVLQVVDLSLWTRLRTLVFKDAFLGSFVMSSMISRDSAQGLQILYDRSASFSRDAAWCLQDDLNVQVGDENDGKMSCIEKISVLLDTQKQKEALLRHLAGSLLRPRITVLVKSATDQTASETTTLA